MENCCFIFTKFDSNDSMGGDLFRLTKVLLSLTGMLFRLTEVLFRQTSVLFKPTNMLFRLIRVLDVVKLFYRMDCMYFGNLHTTRKSSQRTDHLQIKSWV